MYNLYDKNLRGNSIGCCPLYVGYYLLYVLTWELNRYGRRRRRRTTTTTHFKSFQYIDKPIGASPRLDEDGTILVCSTYSTYKVRIGTSKKGGNAPRATDKKSM